MRKQGLKKVLLLSFSILFVAGFLLTAADSRADTTKATEKKEVYRSFFESMYNWFSSIFDENHQFDRKKVATWWHPDGKMITNGEELYVGFDSLNDHWEQVKGEYKTLTVNLPFDQYIEAGDKVIIEYTISGVSKSGDEGIVYDLAVFTLVDGKIAVMREVANIEGFGR